MSDAAERVSVLRERVEEQERELDAAVSDLKVAAQRVVDPVEWLRRNPLPLLAGALALGWWLGARGRGQRRRSR
jgi:hypothetical protein